MRIRKTLAYPLFLACLCFLGGCDFFSPDAAEFQSNINDPIKGYRPQLDLKYGPYAENTLDIYRPLSLYDTPSEVVILLHGGNWTGGAKWFLQPTVDSLQKARKNLTIVNINYRTGPTGTKSLFDCQQEDIRACVDFLKKNASLYNIRKERFAIMGASAGGHIALAYAYKDEQQNIHTVIGMSAITDLSIKELSGPDLHNSIQFMVGQNYSSSDHSKLIAASPVHLANVRSPRTILLYGAKDDVVYLRQQTLLREKLLALRIPNALYFLKNETHNVNAGPVAISILAALGAHDFNTYLQDITLH